MELPSNEATYMAHCTRRIIVSWKELKQLGWPYSRAHTWRMMRDGRFAQCFKLGGHRNAHPVWRLQDVLGWLESYGCVIRDEMDMAS